MQAVRIAGPGRLDLVQCERPAPAFGEVLVEVAWAGVCHTDIEIYGGTHGAYTSGWASYPVVPGHEWAGTVVEIGEGVTRFHVGDAVTGETGIGCMACALCRAGAYNCCPDVVETGIINRDGGMRQYHTHPAAFTHPIGDIPLSEAALIEPATVGVYACLRAGLKPGESVAICGGGSIGQLCAQAAKTLGASVVVLTSRSDEKLRLALELGADAALQAASPDLCAQATAANGGALFDVTIEAAGSYSALNDAVQLAAPRGRVTVVGCASSEAYGFTLEKIIGVELTMIGVRGSPGVWPQTIDLVRAGKLQLAPLVSHRLPLERAEEAFRIAQTGGTDVMKVLLKN